MRRKLIWAAILVSCFILSTIPVKAYPTMGNTGVGATAFGIINNIAGIKDVSPSASGWGSSISAYLKISLAAANVKCAIYNATTGKFLMGTDVKSVTSMTGAWYTFTFTSKVQLFKNVHYRVVAWAQSSCSLLRETLSYAGEGINASKTYGVWPDPFSSPATTQNYKFSIYCTYVYLNMSYTNLDPAQNEIGVPFDETDGIWISADVTSTFLPTGFYCYWSTNWTWNHINGSKKTLYNYGGSPNFNIRPAFNGTKWGYINTTITKSIYFNLTRDEAKNLSIRSVCFRSNTPADPDDLTLYRSYDHVTWTAKLSHITTVQDTNAWVWYNFSPPFSCRYLRIDILGTEETNNKLIWGCSPNATIFKIYAGEEFKNCGYDTLIVNGTIEFLNSNVTLENHNYSYYIESDNDTYDYSAYAPWINFTTGFLASYIPPDVGGVRLFSIPMIVIYGFAGGWFFMFFWRRRKKKIV